MKTISIKPEGHGSIFQGISTILGTSALSKPGKVPLHPQWCYLTWCMQFSFSIFPVRVLTQNMHESLLVKTPLHLEKRSHGIVFQYHHEKA